MCFGDFNRFYKEIKEIKLRIFLDFENIKGSLKRFLSNQYEFKDYDFEGSSIAVIFDLLS